MSFLESSLPFGVLFQERGNLLGQGGDFRRRKKDEGADAGHLAFLGQAVFGDCFVVEAGEFVGDGERVLAGLIIRQLLSQQRFLERLDDKPRARAAEAGGRQFFLGVLANSPWKCARG
jgi:hypothetical protein